MSQNDAPMALLRPSCLERVRSFLLIMIETRLISKITLKQLPDFT
jgi:hypothetical protein